MKNISFPGWAGPLIGLAAGALVALRITVNAPQGDRLLVFVLAMGIGLIAGLIVFLADRSTKPKRPTDPFAEIDGRTEEEPEDIESDADTRAAAIIFIMAFLWLIAPFINIFVSGLSCYANRKRKGRLITSIVLLVLSLGLTSVIFIP